MKKKDFIYRRIKRTYKNIIETIKKDSSLRFMLIMPVVGLIYYGFILATGNSIPCLFYTLTGYYCPGCGLTTMVLFIGEADFLRAFEANRAVFVILPFVILLYIASILSKFICSNRIKIIYEKHKVIVEMLLLVYLIAFGIIRNIT